jgi:3-hydroxybutyryl-CoA dehydrogenase
MADRIGIIGAGTMGNGIAQVCATAGLSAVMTHISNEAVARGHKSIDGSLDRLVKKEEMTANAREAALGRIVATTNRAALVDCDFVIEAATENEALKVKILRELGPRLNPDAIIATNTSSISITKLAAATSSVSSIIWG